MDQKALDSMCASQDKSTAVCCNCNQSSHLPRQMRDGQRHRLLRGKRRRSSSNRKHRRACCTCKNLQLRPRTSYLSNWDISRKPSEANTMGLSGRLGSQMQKFCAASQSLRDLETTTVA